MKLVDKYLSERMPDRGVLMAYNKGIDIKDAALAFTGEVETLMSNLLKDWSKAGELSEFDKGEIAKMVNLAVKGIKVKKVISGF
jgi:2,3-bisphosphoglycerate-independent phosphoglycerate mutase